MILSDCTDNSTPTLSAIVVTAGTFRTLRRTVRHLRAQTVANQIELVIVAPSAEAIADHSAEDFAGFHSVQAVFPGPIPNVDRAIVDGVYVAKGDLIAMIEDHAYPEPDWAWHTIESFKDGWGGAACTVVNANPDGLLSWTNLLIAYGPWTEPSRSGERPTLPAHNTVYRRELLLEYGESLRDKLGRSALLPADLQKKGHRLYFVSAARVAHVNPSRFSATANLRFNAGRLYGANRARENDWTPLHRIIYVLGSPAIPFIQYRNLRRELFRNGRRKELLPRVLPGLFLGSVLDTLGQVFGYAFGPGPSEGILAVFEIGRMRHLTASDRRKLEE